MAEEICRIKIEENIINVQCGKPLTMPLRVLNEDCNFKKIWDKFAGKDEEAKAKKKAHNQKPENKAKTKAYNKAYYQRPKIKAKLKARAKAYYQRPEIKAKHKAYNKARYQRNKLGVEE